MLLVIPFLVVDNSVLQVPIYVYVLALQWNVKHRGLAVVMLLSVGLVTFFDEIGVKGGLLARVLAALLVAKDVQMGEIVGSMLRSLWLRLSFAFVLALLFWFSLLTVNVFHLVLIIVVLLFVVKNERVEQRSYRHRNWKYLQLLFNIFLLSRLAY